ncbi:MAG TPA: 30S ribosomal protein S12 methylthiotransferase RimO [Phycisphaerae bacterium]|nr:30S ribosomal protein S12 methylthiotransferase RimO [Phycisphaerae bacterium]HRR87153.1 30S ribosomal protein S12 methylthiotransferase RimO [Phycisphaerae bacterium]
MTEPTTVALVSLGCVKNLVDSEKILGQLAERGAVIAADPADADIIVINTCGFLQAARAEGHKVIAEMLRYRRSGRCRRIVVVGCLVQRDGHALLDAFPEIDALVSVHRRDDVPDAVLAGTTKPAAPPSQPRRRSGAKAGHRRQADLYLGAYHPHVALDTARLRLTPRHYAYLRISEGCNQKCSFCNIPAIRGPMRSKPPQVVLAEARELISDGAAELNIIGQDTTAYGKDLHYRPGLAGLLRQLDKLDGLRWIRLLYAYPTAFTDDMIDAVAECSKVVKYVDLPLQHINDRILKAMRRRVTRAQIEALLDKLRRRVPDVAIRTTLIAGFPGETEEEFDELIHFVRQMRFAAVGVFAYSQEPDTPAGRFEAQLPEKVKQQRVEVIMKTQQEIAFAHAAGLKGHVLEVLVDEKAARGRYIARHAGQAPDVDAVTYVLSDKVHPGRFVQVRCEASEGYDLIARPVDDILPNRKTGRTSRREAGRSRPTLESLLDPVGNTTKNHED